MDAEKLKAEYGRNEVVKVICDHMARRDRNQNETTLRRILPHLESDGHDFKKSEIIGGFRALENADCGKYVEGRHGWPSRFVWSVKSKHVAGIAVGREAYHPEDEQLDEEELELVEHSFPLRPELTLSIELPPDLSEREAARLARFVRSLPFNADE